MQSILLQLYLFGLFSTSVGQQQAPACLPERWEAEAVGDVAEIASTSGGVEIFYLRYRQSYDFTNKRESTQQLVEIGNVTRRITTVTDWTKVCVICVFGFDDLGFVVRIYPFRDGNFRNVKDFYDILAVIGQCGMVLQFY